MVSVSNPAMFSVMLFSSWFLLNNMIYLSDKKLSSVRGQFMVERRIKNTSDVLKKKKLLSGRKRKLHI